MNRYNDSCEASFLADNWALDVNEWENCAISYRTGGGYLAQIKSSCDSIWTIIIIPGDSIVFKRGNINENYSIRTLMADSLWMSHFNPQDLYNKTRFVLDNNIKSIKGYNNGVEINLFNTKGDVVLFKGEVPNMTHWRSLGDGWYTQRDDNVPNNSEIFKKLYLKPINN